MPNVSSTRRSARSTSAMPDATAAPAAPLAEPLAGCGCAMPTASANGEPRKAVAVDAGAKERNRKRLRRIEGQVRGLQKMVDDDRYCADILTQIASVHEALRAVGRELMRNHLKHCATAAIRQGQTEAEGMYDELVEMVYRTAR